MAIKVILSDLGNVILKFDGILVFDNRVSQLTGKTPEEVNSIVGYGKSPDDPYGSFMRGKVSQREFFYQIREKLGLKIAFEEFRELWCNVMKPNARVIDLWRKLHYGEGLEIDILSNLDEMHYDWVKRYFRFDDFVSQALYSFRFGYAKPEEKIFSLAFCRLKEYHFDEVVFVDDHRDNIEAAKKFGFMHSVLFTGNFEALCQELKRLGVRV